MSMNQTKKSQVFRFGLPVAFFALLVAVAGPTKAQAAVTSTPTSWSNFTFVPYEWGGRVVYDHESSQDPSHGQASGVAPAVVDIASCSADGRLPGSQPSALIAFYDDGAGGEWLAFRMRLNDTPVERATGATGYMSRLWNVLLDIDGDGYKEYVVSVDGTHASTNDDRVFVYYENTNTQEIDTASDTVDEFVASTSNVKSHTRIVEDTSVLCQGKREYWLDVQVPLSVFAGNILAATPFRMFMSTSTTREVPLLKDWMESVCEGDPAGTDFLATSPLKMGALYTPSTNTLADETGSLVFRLFKDSNGDLLLNKGDSALSSFVANYVVKNSVGTTVSSFNQTGLTAGTGTGLTYQYRNISLNTGTHYLEGSTADDDQSFLKSMPVQFEVGYCGATTVDVPVGPFGTGTSDFYVFAFHDLDGNGIFDKATENIYPAGAVLDLEVNGNNQCTLAADGLGAPNPAACIYNNNGANTKTFSVVGDWVTPGFVPSTPTTFKKEMTARTPGGFISFGFVKASTISGVVFNDLNGDGFRDSQEPPILGVTVTLTRPDSSTANTTTNASGYYEFTGIAVSGTYYLSETDLGGYSSTTPNFLALNVNASSNSTANFGDVSSGQISGYVFSDLNGDTRQQPVEPKLGGILVSLFDANGELYASTRTAPDGSYNFTVVPGAYTVVVSVPDGYEETSATTVSTYVPTGGGAAVVFGMIPYGTIINMSFEDKNANGSFDLGEQGLTGIGLPLTEPTIPYSGDFTSSADGTAAYFRLTPLKTYTANAATLGDYTATTPLTVAYPLLAADAKVNFFGYVLEGTIAGSVFFDLNQNGVRDAGEAGINNVTVTIKNSINVTVATATTDFTGAYAVNGLSAGTYSVVETDPADHISTTNNTLSVTLASNGSATASFGDVLVGIISGQVRLDSNNNGVLESTDAILPGVRIDLDDGSFTVSDSQGNYSFFSKSIGSYDVLTDEPSGYYAVTNSTVGVTLTALANGKADFLLNGPGRISGTLYFDSNNNGSLDSADTVLDTRSVGLSNSSISTTDTDGFYTFSSLPSGGYTITPPSISGCSANPASYTLTLSPRQAQNIDFKYTGTCIAGGTNLRSAVKVKGSGSPDGLEILILLLTLISGGGVLRLRRKH